jgi:hypothetical protein
MSTNTLSSQLIDPQISTPASPVSSTRLYHPTTDDTDEMLMTAPLAHATPTPTKRQNFLTPSTAVTAARIPNRNGVFASTTRKKKRAQQAVASTTKCEHIKPCHQQQGKSCAR